MIASHLGERIGLVGDHDHRLTDSLSRADRVHERLFAGGIKRGIGLIEHDQRGHAIERAGKAIRWSVGRRIVPHQHRRSACCSRSGRRWIMSWTSAICAGRDDLLVIHLTEAADVSAIVPEKSSTSCGR